MALIKASLFALSLLAATWVHADDSADIQRHLKAGNATEALKVADQALTAKPKDPQLRFLRGVSLTELNRSGEAIAAFVKLTEDFPELPEPFNNLAVLYAGQGQYDKARSALEMAIRTNPSYGTAYENLGDVYAKLASQAYSKALQIDGANQAVPPKLALIRDLFSPRSGHTSNTSTPPTAKSPPVAVVASPTPPLSSTSAAQPSSTSTPPLSNTTTASSAVEEESTAAKPSTTAAPAGRPTQVVIDSAGVAPPASAAILTPAIESEISKAIHNWANAWSRRDMKAYFAAYAKTFEAGKPRSEWEAERKSRIINRSAINVKVTDIKVTSLEDNKAEIEFNQDYESGNIKSSSVKTLQMIKSGSRWLIQRETSSS